MVSDVTTRAAAAPDDIAALRAFLMAERGPEATRRLDLHLARPRYRPDFTLVAERAGAIAGYALLAHQRRHLGATTLDVGVLEDIYVQAALRGQGIFQTLMGDYLRVLLEQGIALADLRGPASLFMPLGFAPYRFTATISVEARAAQAAQPISPAQLRPARDNDLDDLAALYEASYRELPLSEARTAPDWRVVLADQRETLVLEDGRGRVVAYAVVGQRFETELRVVEAGAADAGAARALLAALLAGDKASIVLGLAPGHLAAQAALQLGGRAELTAASADPGGRLSLAGVVDLTGILQALAPEFERRLARSRYAGWSGNLRVEIETERITLALASGRATVIDGTRPADVRLREVALPALPQLFLGYRAVADLRATHDLACDDSALGLLDALFPVVMGCGAPDDW